MQTHTSPAAWRPSGFLRFSAAVHVGAAAAAIVRPQLWPWMAGAVIANHLALAAAGLWPRSRILGPNLRRLPAAAAAAGGIAITIDDGPDPEITPQVLSLLDEHAAKATFFCVGEKVRQHAALAREILQRGHAVENHSLRHRHNFALLGPRGMADEVGRAQQVIGAVTGVPPRLFRAPAGLRNPFLDPVLTRFDLQLASWTRRGFDTVTRNPDAVLARLARGLAGGDILLLHDGHAARSSQGRPVVLDVLPRLLKRVAAAGLTPVTLRSTLP